MCTDGQQRPWRPLNGLRTVYWVFAISKMVLHVKIGRNGQPQPEAWSAPMRAQLGDFAGCARKGKKRPILTCSTILEMAKTQYSVVSPQQFSGVKSRKFSGGNIHREAKVSERQISPGSKCPREAKVP